jgi:hypothetical protein
MAIFWIMVLIGVLGYAYTWLSRRQVDDAEALGWTTLREPLIFIQETAFDRGVSARYSHAIAMLKQYGNPYLKEEDIFLRVYRIHMNLLTDVKAIEYNHSVFYDQAVREAAQWKQQWLQTKTGYNLDAATKIFARQN